MVESLAVFVLAATALLGSPGPGIAALMAVGRARGAVGGLRYFGAMQIGLALAAALTAGGLVALLQAVPLIRAMLTIISVIYLLWLAWSIASAPLSESVGIGTQGAFTLAGGFMLGFANPKAYLAFASLFGSFSVLQPAYGLTDTLIKWIALVVVMALVDLAWLLAGVALGRVSLSRRAERSMNVIMGGAILLALLAALM